MEDSWEGPGSPSHASSPLGSREELLTSGSGEEGYIEQEEVEEEIIMSEFRELYKGMTSTMQFDFSSESLDSTGEDTEKLKAKLNSLKIYVLELKESYDELLKAFSQLELSSKDSVADMEGVLATKIAAVKNLQNQIERLENLISELNNKLGQAEAQNARLKLEKTHLLQENAQFGVLNSALEQQVMSLQDASEECDLLQQDLGHVLELVTDGVTGGTLKLSELSLQTQCVTLPHSDLPLGPNTNDQLVDHYQEELTQIRQELNNKASELEKLRGELATLKEEQDGALRELAENKNLAETALSERDQLDQEVSEAQERATSLEREVESLTQKLEQAHKNQHALSETLSTTRQAMEIYQKTALQDVEHRDQELTQLKFELSTLEQQRTLLEQQVKESKKEVKNLDGAHRKAQEEITALRKVIEELTHKKGLLDEAVQESEVFERHLQEKELELEMVRDEKDRLESQLSDHVVALQSQIDSVKMEKERAGETAFGYESQLQTLRELHSQCEGEANKLRSLLESKEAELSKMLTALQIAAAQISAFRPRVTEDGPRSPGTVNKELTQCGLAVQAVERELQGHRKQWEDVLLSVEQHKTTVEALSAERDQLSRDVQLREQRVAELEALLQEVNDSHNGIHQDNEAILEQLKKELRETRDQHQQASDEIADLQDKLQQSQASATEQHQLLSTEVQKREEIITDLQSDGQELKQRYESVCEQVEASQKANEALQNEYDRVLEELASREQDVVKLEDQVEDGSKRQEELARCSQAISELKQQLELSQQQLASEKEKAELNEEELDSLKSQHCHLTQQLRDKDEMVKRLEEETAFLDKQHSDVQQEVERHQKLIESLQESLASSQGLCDGLQHEVSECERELQELQEKLHTSYQEKLLLQEQLMQLTAELRAAQGEVDIGVEDYALLKRTSEEQLDQLQTNIEDLQSDLSRVMEQRELLENASEEQRAELVRLRLAVSDLELLKESLLFQGSTKEGTIGSLESQIATLEAALQDNEDNCLNVEQELTEAREHYNMLESQLATANDKLLEVEQSKSVLEVVSSERLSEITQLQQKVEESEVREGLVNELRELVASLEGRLGKLQAEGDALSGRLLESDRSRAALEKVNAERRVAIAHLEQKVSDGGVEKELVSELREQIDCLEEQLGKLQTQLEVSQDEILASQSTALLTKEKEHHWSTELSQAAAEVQLYKERVSRLEGEVKERNQMVDELRNKLDVAQHRQEINSEELTSSHHVEENLYSELAEKRKLLLDLEHQLGCYRDELTTVKGQLAVSEECRQRLLQQMGELEEDFDGLKHCHSETEMELANARANLSNRKSFCHQLQEDCEQMTERVTSWAQEQKSSTDALAQRISDQEAIIASLKHKNRELTTENEELQIQLPPTSSTQHQQQQTDPLNSSGSNISLQSYPSITRLRAQVDVDIGNLALTPGATVGFATASTSVPIKFDSHYRAAMEKGVSPPSLEEPVRFGGSETESEAAALDKDYWIRRAGELSLQLQQSGEYWSQKVRELSLQLEKRNQDPQTS